MSKRASRSGTAIWMGLCIMSPVITALCPRDSISTLTCPGVCPGVGIRDTSSVTLEIRLDEFDQARFDHRIDRIRQMLHVVIAVGVAQELPVLELLASEVIARLREGGHPHCRPPCFVFQPTWSKCRCVHSTSVIDSCGNPAAARSSRNVVCMLVNTSNSRLRSAPMQVSIITVRPRRTQHEALERDDHLAVGRREMRPQPSELLHELRRGVGQQHGDVVFPAIDLDDARDLDVADAPVPDVFCSHESPVKSG